MREVCNPRTLTDLWDGREIGDPFLMRHDGRFYLYCSSHGGPGIKCWVSDDMIDFTYAGLVCEDERIRGAYAPEVMYNAGKFWMVTSPVGSGHYMLRADRPLGPFEVISDNYGLGIDGSLFLDDDGRSWFYRASHEGIRVHAMPSPDRIDVQSHPIPASYLGHWTEGPMVIKRDGRYFLTETGNHVLSKGYRVDYCVSHEGPDRGYRKLRETTLLLETRDEFHALGHSSTCVGPDMDTMYIVYHKNILDERNRPLYRSLNMDALHFNGDRMYANATWWPQSAPRQPVCLSRNGRGLVPHSLGRALPEGTGSTYTAEVCLTLTGERANVFFSAQSEMRGMLTLHRDRRWRCELPEKTLDGILPKAAAMDALMTVKVSLRRGCLILTVNGMEILRTETKLAGGAIGISGDAAPSFMGFSDVAQGSGEKDIAKAVPGAFDAVHALESGKTAAGERGCSARFVQAGETLHWPINVWKTGRYYLAVTMRATADDLHVQVNGEDKIAPPTGAADVDGMEKRFLGVVPLEAGTKLLPLTAMQDAVIDRIYLTEADEMTPMVVIRDGEDVSGGALKVIGHKQQKSMLRKFSGYTCAEGYGEGYVGGNWRDMQISATLHMEPCSPDAKASLYLRCSRESWHPHQVADGRIAYCLRIKPDRMELLKQHYDETVLAVHMIDRKWPDALSIVFGVQGSRIMVWEQTNHGMRQIFDVIDPMALLCGKAGFDATGDGIGFEAVKVDAVPENNENTQA